MEFLDRSWPLVFALALACTPEFEVDLSIVDRPRVLALASMPAEAEPGETVTLTALVAGPDGTLAQQPLDWSLCLARRPLAELGPIAPECLAAIDDDVDDSAIESLGFAVSLDAALPDDACRLFGPEPPPAMPGEPTGRPVEPDLTGGYYQPVLGVLEIEDIELNLLKVRLACGVAGATQAQAAEYTLRYTRNVAPAVVEFGIADGASTVEAGDRVELRVSWPDCPSEPGSGCSGAETHVFFDPIDLEIETRREAISVAWYTSAGKLDDARTGLGSNDLEVASRNGWTAPLEAGTVHLWVVLRDDRGGTGWAQLGLQVLP